VSAPKRRTLGDLNSGDPAVPDLQPSPLPKAVPPARPASRSVQVARSLTSGDRDSVTTEAGSPGQPKYLRLERKDVLLWPRQMHELTVLRRVLNRRRPKGQGERITENSVIRVAIDYLLAHAGELEGYTEEELRKSLGL
jgi:hypothetical protein